MSAKDIEPLVISNVHNQLSNLLPILTLLWFDSTILRQNVDSLINCYIISELLLS